MTGDRSGEFDFHRNRSAQGMAYRRGIGDLVMQLGHRVCRSVSVQIDRNFNAFVTGVTLVQAEKVMQGTAFRRLATKAGEKCGLAGL
jgi:hypothetical protein